MNLINKGEHLEPVLEVLNRLHPGNVELKTSLLLACCAKSVVKIPHIIVGSSKSGMSHIQNTIMEIIPEEYTLVLDRISEKALFYMCKDDPAPLKNKILFLDDLKNINNRLLRKIIVQDITFNTYEGDYYSCPDRGPSNS